MRTEPVGKMERRVESGVDEGGDGKRRKGRRRGGGGEG